MTNRPNIILITTDQQRYDSLACYGSPFMNTPNMDRLAAEGALLKRAYCTNPVCTPSRASIFSGQYVSRHGAWNVGTHVPDDLTMVSHRLKKLDYQTHYIGKTHFQSYGGDPEFSHENIEHNQSKENLWDGPYFGFDQVELAFGHVHWGMTGQYGQWVREQLSEKDFEEAKQVTGRASVNFYGQAFDWSLPNHLHNSAWIAERSISFLNSAKSEKPFFLALGFQDPHPQCCVCNDFEDRVSLDDLPEPDYTLGELADKPPYFQAASQGHINDSDSPFRGEYEITGFPTSCNATQVPADDSREGRAYYYNMVQLIDRELGRILDCLDQRGLTENTMVIFTTDHGEMLGDHGLWGKGPFHYDQLIRVPLLVRYPKAIPAGQKLEGLISLADLTPTIMAAVGKPCDDDVDGVNAMPLLSGQAETTREHVLVECVDDPSHIRLKTLVTNDRKITWHCEQTYGELYDLINDPQEKINLWSDPNHTQEKAKLLSELLSYSERLERREKRHCYA